MNSPHAIKSTDGFSRDGANERPKGRYQALLQTESVTSPCGIVRTFPTFTATSKLRDRATQDSDSRRRSSCLEDALNVPPIRRNVTLGGEFFVKSSVVYSSIKAVECGEFWRHTGVRGVRFENRCAFAR